MLWRSPALLFPKARLFLISDTIERMALGVSDAERMSKSVAGIVGKRLTYHQPRPIKTNVQEGSE
jgi:hypothetical protein